MNTKSLYIAVKPTVRHTSGPAVLHSKSWYRERPQEILHSTIRNLDDALTASRDEVIWIVYFRVIKKLDENNQPYYELETLGRAKIGKGYFEGGSETRDPAAGGSDGILETWAAVACRDEQAALALEEILHETLKARGRWLGQIANAQGKRSGEEWFDGWSREKQQAIDEFYQLVQSATRATNVGQQKFNPRYYQDDGSTLIAEFLQNSGDMNDFFLLFKPRAGKNATALLGFSKFAKASRDHGNGGTILVDFVSQWPSAFGGMIRDIKDYIYQDGITIAPLRTDRSDWVEKQQEMYDRGIDVIVRLVSMQSINQAYASECEEDEDYEGLIEGYDQNKVSQLKLYSTPYCIIDESDHGMRTLKSQKFLSEFGYFKKLWMSGTDLYALKHEIRSGNHVIYDIIQERQDIESGRFGPEIRSKMRLHKVAIKDLPFADLVGDLLDVKELSRRQRNLCQTTQSSGKAPNNPGVDGLYRDAQGKIIEFQKPDEVISAFNLYYSWTNLSDIPGPCDHDHLFWTMPSVSSCKALHNLIAQKKVKECHHRPLLANQYGSAFDIENEVNNDMKRHGRTVFITVGRMLRGAKAPWSGVVRWDDYSDFKLGLQLCLRGQNTDAEWFDVYDCNPYRVSVMRYDLIRTRTDGKKIDSEGKKYHRFVPVYRLGSFETAEESWEETVEEFQQNSIREGFRRMSLLDEKGVELAADFLIEVEKTKSNKSQDRDPAAGREGSVDRAAPPPGLKKTPNEIDDLKKRALTISSMIPLLVLLTGGKYTEIDDLFDAVNDDEFSDWVRHSVPRWSGDVDCVKIQIKNLFDTERINEQINVVCRRVTDDGINDLNWQEFDRGKEGDVSTPRPAVERLLGYIKDPKFWSQGPKCFDPSCGSGEWLVYEKALLESHGFDPKEYLFWADFSPLNLRIVRTRLGFDNGLCFNNVSKGDSKTVDNLYKQCMDKFGMMKFDLYATNPPFQRPDKSGRDNDNLWPAFLALGDRVTAPDGYRVLITPASWASLGTNDTAPGSKIRKNHFDPWQVEAIDFTIGDYFTEGSTFSGYVIKHAKTDPTLDTVMVFKDNVVVDKFSDYPCFSLGYSESEFISIIKDFRNKQHYHIIMEDPYTVARSAMPKKIKDGRYSLQKDADHPYRAYHTNAQTHLYSNYKNTFHNQWKVVFSYSGTWKVEVTDDCSLTDASMCILCNSQAEADSVASVMNSRPVKFLIDKVFRWGGYYSGLFIRWIPALPMNKIYTDDEVIDQLFTSSQASIITGYLEQEDQKQQEQVAKKAAAALKKAQAQQRKQNRSKDKKSND